jgi:hypothetical protein
MPPIPVTCTSEARRLPLPNSRVYYVVDSCGQRWTHNHNARAHAHQLNLWGRVEISTVTTCGTAMSSNFCAVKLKFSAKLNSSCNRSL